MEHTLQYPRRGRLVRSKSLLQWQVRFALLKLFETTIDAQRVLTHTGNSIHLVTEIDAIHFKVDEVDG